MNLHRELTLNNQPTFVVGDIHGCAQELTVLLDHLSEQSGAQTANYIFVGDYINRGDFSRAVVECLIQFKEQHRHCIFLKGNHEDMLCGFLGRPSSRGDIFLRAGGSKTLASYGIASSVSVEERSAQFPSSHLDFIDSLENMLVTEKFIFVHAGLAPLVPLSEQRPAEIFWIRDEFINNPHSFERTVVFGHTPFKAVFVDWPYKLGIDTGLVYGNMLSCLELNSRQLIQIKSGSKRIRSGTLEI